MPHLLSCGSFSQLRLTGQSQWFKPYDRQLAGNESRAYAIYVDEHDKVWLSDFTSNSIVHFDPDTGEFTRPAPRPGRMYVTTLSGSTIHDAGIDLKRLNKTIYS